MGTFLAVTAFRSTPASDVAEAIKEWFATDPASLTAKGASERDVAQRWRGDPRAVAAVMGAKAREVARHYRRNRKSHLFDEWAYVDLWATLGITYPHPGLAGCSPARCL
jgi:hypothetical protein